MANAITTQVLVDGPCNVVVKISGTLDTSDANLVVVVDPALLLGIDNTGLLKAKHLVIKKLSYSTKQGLSVALFWDATAPVKILDVTGMEDINAEKYGGFPDNSGAGSTGKIKLSTTGWGSGVASFLLVLEMFKQQS
jgi:hypothetical protein